MGLSYYSAWHWGRADWTLGFWLLLSLSLGLGWSMACWPGHYIRECARLSRHVFAHLNFSLCREYLPLAWASRTVLASAGQGFGRLTITILYHIHRTCWHGVTWPPSYLIPCRIFCVWPEWDFSGFCWAWPYRLLTKAGLSLALSWTDRWQAAQVNLESTCWQKLVKNSFSLCYCNIAGVRVSPKTRVLNFLLGLSLKRLTGLWRARRFIFNSTCSPNLS